MNINVILNKRFDELTPNDCIAIDGYLLDRLLIELHKKDRSGIYGITQRDFAYNSNRIEGSRLSKEQTASLFNTGTIMSDGEIYRAKDIEETNGHFLMFNLALKTMDEVLSETLIKQFHAALKQGVFDDRANGYPIIVTASGIVSFGYATLLPISLVSGNSIPSGNAKTPQNRPRWTAGLHTERKRHLWNVRHMERKSDRCSSQQPKSR